MRRLTVFLQIKWDLALHSFKLGLEGIQIEGQWVERVTVTTCMVYSVYDQLNLNKCYQKLVFLAVLGLSEN
jgi:hypothetical protein